MQNENFEILNQIDEGAFGIVYRARNKTTGEIVAIKKIKKKYTSWDECLKLKEVSSLSKLIHPNIIRLKEVFKQQNELYMVFEYCHTNLFKFYQER
jgi:serine/threonine protein kinase